MKTPSKALLGFLIAFLLSTPTFAQTIKFSTLEWPPYLGEKLPEQGFGVEIVRAAFRAEGIDHVTTDFLPWSRALLVAEQGKEYSGVMLAYYSKERSEKFIYSDPVISGEIKFAMRNDNVISWNKFIDLKNKKIGVVQDYVNNPELDKLISDKTLWAEASASDENNITKLAYKRTDLAVVDTNVFDYLVKTAPTLRPFKDQLQIHGKTLEDKKLYVLFSKNEEGMRLVKIFNRGLKKINPSEIAKKYMAQI